MPFGCTPADITIFANDQLPSDRVFETLNLFAERRLSNVKKFGRPSEVEMLCQRDERLQLNWIQVFHSYVLSQGTTIFIGQNSCLGVTLGNKFGETHED